MNAVQLEAVQRVPRVRESSRLQGDTGMVSFGWSDNGGTQMVVSVLDVQLTQHGQC